MSKFIKFIIIMLLLTADVQLITSIYDNLSASIDYTDFSEKNEFLITGGYRLKDHTWVKNMISLQFKDQLFFGSTHFCGGSIIGDHTILTAAHCLFDKEEKKFETKFLQVVAGSPYRLKTTETTRIYNISKIIIHQDYRKYAKKRTTDDIALLILERNIEWNEWTKKIDIGKITPADGTICIAAGWGNLIYNGPLPDEAVYVDLEILPNENCRVVYSGEYVYNSMICTGNKIFESNICFGDSGGPLICDGTVCGIAAFMLAKYGSSDYPSVFSDVTYYYKWIKKNIACTKNMNQFVFKICIFSIYFINF